MVGLGDLPGGIFSSDARGVSADGSVIVGSSYIVSGKVVFIWDAVKGMRNLQAILEVQLGLNLAGWTLTDARGVSPNGNTIVGYGINPLGATEGWIATLSSVVPCFADINSDNSVNVTDLLALLAAWGPNPGHPADTNGDGTVNVTDLLALLAAWGVCP